MSRAFLPLRVMPAQAGIQYALWSRRRTIAGAGGYWIPAFAGMTGDEGTPKPTNNRLFSPFARAAEVRP